MARKTMPKFLSDPQVEAYHRDGYIYPLPAIGEARAKETRARFEEYEADIGAPVTALGREARYKLHVGHTWAHAIASDPVILDAVEDVIGPNILAWTSTFFVKEPNTDAITMWHQDWAYFGLRPHEHVTAWVALSEASAESGCMELVSAQGAARPLLHKANADPNSINGGGQTIAEPFEREGGVRSALATGEFSLHHTLCVHCSPPNVASDRRIGHGVSYIPTHVKHIGTTRQRAMLVRGQDEYGHFDLEPAPTGDAARNKAEWAKSHKAYRRGYEEQVEWHEAGRFVDEDAGTG